MKDYAFLFYRRISRLIQMTPVAKVACKPQQQRNNNKLTNKQTIVNSITNNNWHSVITLKTMGTWCAVNITTSRLCCAKKIRQRNLALSPALYRSILTTTALPTSRWCSPVDRVISPKYVCNSESVLHPYSREMLRWSLYDREYHMTLFGLCTAIQQQS